MTGPDDRAEASPHVFDQTNGLLPAEQDDVPAGRRRRDGSVPAGELPGATNLLLGGW